jgi:hypothetical protein
LFYYLFRGKKKTWRAIVRRFVFLAPYKEEASEHRQAVSKGAFFSSVAPPSSSFCPRTPAASLCSPPHRRPGEMGKDGLGGDDGPEVPLLLKKTHFHGNCPGCRLDRRKETRTGVPYTEFACMWLVTVCSSALLLSFSPSIHYFPFCPSPSLSVYNLYSTLGIKSLIAF